MKVARTVWTYTKSERIVRDGEPTPEDKFEEDAKAALDEFTGTFTDLGVTVEWEGGKEVTVTLGEGFGQNLEEIKETGILAKLEELNITEVKVNETVIDLTDLPLAKEAIKDFLEGIKANPAGEYTVTLTVTDVGTIEYKVTVG